MKAWQKNLHRALSAPDAPPVLNRDLLARIAASAWEGRPVPASTLSHWIRRAKELDELHPIQRGLYLNAFRHPPGRTEDAAGWLRNEAVVSLNTVLGDAGVLNNPVHSVTAVVPLDHGHPPPSLGRVRTRIASFHFFGLPRTVLEAGPDDDRLEPPGRHEHARATPEKALVDWLYLAESPRSRRRLPPSHDLDFDLLDIPRLYRLARATNLTQALQTHFGNHLPE